MEFEHLVEVNDANGPHAAVLDRAQVWAGLMHRVEDARPFLQGLDLCEIVVRGEGYVERRLRFGATEIRDRASFVEHDWVCFETPAGENHGGGRLTIRIEEPAPRRLFLRFAYDTVFARGAEAEDAAYAGFLRQAYEAADIDTVRVIHSLAAGGDGH